MEKQILVSIVVLSYNHETFIERSMLSVIHQTFKDFEIIYIDNNSHDESFERGLKVLEESAVKFYAEKTPLNLGIAKGLNYGLKHSKGEYVSILAGDDWWDIENLSEKVKYALANPDYGMIYGNGYAYNNETQAVSLFYKTPSVSGWIFLDLLKASHTNAHGVLYKHNLIKSLGYFDENGKVEDLDLWLRIAKISPIGYVHKALIFYRYNNGNNISNNFEYMLEGTDYIFKQYENEYPKEIKMARLKQYQGFAYSLAEHKPSFTSLKFILKNYKFDLIYNKQLLKCLIKLVKKT